MSAAENIATAQRGYAAFGAGDAAGAMADMADDIEWITPGNSAISGTTHGKQELGANWAQLAEKGFTTTPQHWYADPSLSTSGETRTIEESMTLRARTESAGHVGDEHERRWCWSVG